MDPACQTGELSESLGAGYPPHLDLLVWNGADLGIYRPIDRGQAEFASSDSPTAFAGAGAMLFCDR
jgi:hypothetical protein